MHTSIASAELHVSLNAIVEIFPLTESHAENSAKETEETTMGATNGLQNAAIVEV